MSRLPLREPDFAFGQTMLTLRSAIRLTQAEMATRLGVSRNSLVAWETGASYPHATHLKKFIELALRSKAFTAGVEAEEIRSLWSASRQKVLFDEAWLQPLLSVLRPPDHAVHSAQTLALDALDSTVIADLVVPAAPQRLDWNDALSVPSFFGREQELELLSGWVVTQRCQVVGVLGLGGVGKSALSVMVMRRVAESFDFVLWRSLRNSPPCEALVDSCLQVLAPQELGRQAGPTERTSALLRSLQARRTLLVLDNLESLFDASQPGGRVRPELADYAELLRLVAETEHQSCILLTSREKPGDLLVQESNKGPVRFLRLGQMDSDAANHLLAEQGLTGTPAEQERLASVYAGNPLALKIVSQTILDLFGGEIGLFFEESTLIFGGVRELLARQFDRLSPLEQSVVYRLAIMREPQTLRDLRTALVPAAQAGALLEAVNSLSGRSMAERGQAPASFGLHSVVSEYVTARLLAEVGAEIQSGTLAMLLHHELCPAFAPDYVREMQRHLLLEPLLEQLASLEVRGPDIEERLRSLLDKVRERPEQEQGYAPANLVALLLQLRGNLRGLDLSRLALRGAYFQGVEMQDASLAGASIIDSAFTDGFDTILGIDISSGGKYWAVCTGDGHVWLWELAQGRGTGAGLGSFTLRHIWRDPADIIWRIALSPDGQRLATGDWLGVIKLWDVTSGTLRWSSTHTAGSGRTHSLKFSSDGAMLAAGVDGAGVSVLDAHSGALLQTLPHPDLVEQVDWLPHSRLPDGRLLATCDSVGCIRLWEVSPPAQPHCLQEFVGHEQAVAGLAFAPDGSLLGTTSLDGTLKIWSVNIIESRASAPDSKVPRAVTADGATAWVHANESQILTLWKTLSEQNLPLRILAWSPDGDLLAFTGPGTAVWLWDVRSGRYRAVLAGHATRPNALAFTPDGRNLLSGGSDGKLTLWNTAMGWRIHMLQGVVTALTDLDWSGDSEQIVSAGENGLLNVHDARGVQPSRILGRDTETVVGLAWAPDGSKLATVTWENRIRLRDPASGEERGSLSHPDDPNNRFYGLAYSPDGRMLASGTLRYGVLLWNIAESVEEDLPALPVLPVRWPLNEFPAAISCRIEWSPDGHYLAAGGADGSIFIYDGRDGALIKQLTGHHSALHCLAWSPSGRMLASGSGSLDEGELFVWDIASSERAKVAGVFVAHQGVVHGVAWGQDDASLISGNDKGVLRWWDLQSGEPMRQIAAHQGRVRGLRKSRDKTTVASFGIDGAILLWSLRGDYLRMLRLDRPYERLDISGARGLTDAQKDTMHQLGALDKTKEIA